MSSNKLEIFWIVLRKMGNGKAVKNIKTYEDSYALVLKYGNEICKTPKKREEAAEILYRMGQELVKNEALKEIRTHEDAYAWVLKYERNIYTEAKRLEEAEFAYNMGGELRRMDVLFDSHKNIN